MITTLSVPAPAQSNTNNHIETVIREVEKNILSKLETTKKDSNQIEGPYLTATMKKLEKQITENNKHVRNHINNSDESKQAKENEIKLTRIVLKPLDRDIKNSRDLREKLKEKFPEIHATFVRISAGGSFVFVFENEEGANEVQNNWSKDFFGGNSGIIKINDRNKVGIVKHVYCDYNEEEIAEEIEINYPGVKYEQFKREGKLTGMIKITFKDETELNDAIVNKFKLFNRKYPTEPFKSKPRVIKCNTCQMFGHVSRRCRNQANPVCGKCTMQGHQTKDCQAKETEYKCFHCSKSDHITGSYKCEKIQEKLEVLKERRENGQ